MVLYKRISESLRSKFLPAILNSLGLSLLAFSSSFDCAGDAQAQTAKAKAAHPHPTANRTGAAHAAAGAPSAASTAQTTAYLNRLRQKLINSWQLPDGSNHVTVSGNFNGDGLSDNLKAVSSPKNNGAEDAAMQAFNKCMPLEALPTGMNGAKVTVDFSSSADPHGDSKSNVGLRIEPVKAEAPKAAAPAAPAAQTAEPAK